MSEGNHDENPNELASEFAVIAGFTMQMEPFITLHVDEDKIEGIHPVVAFQLGMQLILKSRAVMDERALIEVLAARDIPADTTLSIIDALRRRRARIDTGN